MAKVTIHDVARLSGVHRSTVSRVLTGSGPASQEAREKVLAASKQLNYHPNTVAGALKSKRRTTWGLLSSWACSPNSMDHFYAKTLGGLLDSAARVNFRVTLYNFQGRFDEGLEPLRFCHDSHLAGIAILAPRTQDSFLAELKSLDIPCLLLSHRPQDPSVSFVDLDNVVGARLVVEHMISLGHRRISFIGGELALNSNARDRFQGYQEALRRAGIPEVAELVKHGQFDPNHGRMAMKELLQLPPQQRPTAVFCATDLLALAVMDEARVSGLSLPGDLSVAGFDDSPVAATSRPSLTTVRQPFYEMGLQAGDLLHQMMEKKIPMPVRKLYEANLIPRESTAPPRA